MQEKGSTESSDDDSDESMPYTNYDSEENENKHMTQELTDDNIDNTSTIKEDEEDEVIMAIKRECERKNDHPAVIHCEEFITDITFHPERDILAVANILGDVVLYNYSNNENTIVNTLELHTKACRDIKFNLCGDTLFSTSKDKSVMLSDVDSGKLMRFYESSHDVPVYCITVLDDNLFSTGDDDGTVKLWDLRQNGDQPIFKTKKNEDYISDMVTNQSHKYLLCSSGDGSLTTIDMNHRKVHMQSEEYDEELTCLGLFRAESKLVAGSSNGKLYLYNWGEFGLHSDAFPGVKTPINAMVPVTENIVVTASEDGTLRATHLFPHKHLGIVGQHDLSVEHVDISSSGQFIASSSYNNDIKFWNVQYFEDFEKVSYKQKKHQRKKDLQNNLPSSKVKNVSDFFSDL